MSGFPRPEEWCLKLGLTTNPLAFPVSHMASSEESTAATALHQLSLWQSAVPALNNPFYPKYPQKHVVRYDFQGPSAWAVYLESFIE